MIAVVVVSHSPLAQALVSTALGLVGPQAELVALGLEADESPEAFATRLHKCMAGLAASGLLLLCDLRGGTPHRAALALAREVRTTRPCAVVSDTTLGLLCEALVRREAAHSVSELSEHLARVHSEPQIWTNSDVGAH